jgi:hypothetical protein
MDSLAEHEVYIEKEGRVLDDDEKPAPDVLSVRMAALTHGTSTMPLAEFNQQFDIMRERRRLRPVSELLGLINPSGILRQASGSDTDIPATDPSAEADGFYADVPDLEPANDSDDDGLDGDEPADDEEDLFAESPTLTRLDEGDVELDMDDVPEWYLDDSDYSDSDSDDDDDDA